MSEDTDSTEEQMLEISEQQELDSLKRRADILGIEYGPNIGLNTLRDRVRAKLEENEQQEDENATVEEVDEQVQDTRSMTEVETAPMKKELTPMQLRTKAKNEQMKLVRIRISNMNPAKKDLPGEIITVGNELVGTVRKYVPYGEMSEDGWHVPNIIYKHLKSKRFLNIRVRKDPKTGRDRIEQGMALENSIEVLPPLTQKQLDDLARAQIAAGSVDSGETTTL